MPLLKSPGVQVFVANNIVCKNNTYSSGEIAQKNILQISKITVLENTPKQHTITNAIIESSPFNLLFFGGFADSVQVVHPQSLLVHNITMWNLKVKTETNLIGLSQFIA